MKGAELNPHRAGQAVGLTLCGVQVAVKTLNRREHRGNRENLGFDAFLCCGSGIPITHHRHARESGHPGFRASGRFSSFRLPYMDAPAGPRLKPSMAGRAGMTDKPGFLCVRGGPRFSERATSKVQRANGGSSFSGKTTSIRVPRPLGFALMYRLAPCLTAISCAMANPSPHPSSVTPRTR